ncbi:UNVERIFIED_CONTAM: hypothetical protein HDU68_011144 [Siphonaria sp. JEL0065]|nr:hypothetical protein HDU68_011144 [Siphonaria sp. JEL0065]
MSVSEFITANGLQLRNLGVPESLWKHVFQRIETNRVGSNGEFRIVDKKVVTAKSLSPSEAVLVFQHQWIFTSRDQAKQHLDESEPLRAAIAALVERTTANSIAATTESLLANLYRIAFEFEVKSATDHQKLYSVTLDPFSPCQMPFAQSPLLGAGIFIDTRSNRSYTILWPTSLTSTIPSRTLITRGELTCMPDYSTTEYWKHHYATSKADTTFDWFLPWTTDFANLLKNVLPNQIPSNSPAAIAVLNVGCGNSTAADGMIKDRVADIVINFDISGDAVHTISRAHSKILTPTTPGLQEFSVFDGALSSGFPFRKSFGEGNEKLFSWAFDKGTTDGLLRSSMDIVRQLWINMAEVTDTIVWVSLGRPENRVILIEDEIGGNWEVDQCLQIDGNGGWIKTHYVYVCKQKVQK